MKKRRSIRNFCSKGIPENLLINVLKSGFFAPSGGDQHPYIYIIVDDKNLKGYIKNNCNKIDKICFDNSENWFKDWIIKKIFLMTRFFLLMHLFLLLLQVI
jgi:nitroreductase